MTGNGYSVIVIQSTRLVKRSSDDARRTQLDIHCDHGHNRMECSLQRFVRFLQQFTQLSLDHCCKNYHTAFLVAILLPSLLCRYMFGVCKITTNIQRFL